MPTQACLPTPDKSLWQSLDWEPSCEQLDQLINLQVRLREWNQLINLTRLSEGDDYWVSQVLDSLWPIKAELKSPAKSRRCIDVGTGCGFPGLAIAIALPGAEVSLIDSVHKKTAAVYQIAASIGLSKRVKVFTERVELTGHNPLFRGAFDLAMARAVAKPPVIAEYLVPLIKADGEAILFQGHWTEENHYDLSRALVPLNAEIIKKEFYSLPRGRGLRHQLRLQRTAPCPNAYPRALGIPAKKPLGRNR